MQSWELVTADFLQAKKQKSSTKWFIKYSQQAEVMHSMTTSAVKIPTAFWTLHFTETHLKQVPFLFQGIFSRLCDSMQ